MNNNSKVWVISKAQCNPQMALYVLRRTDQKWIIKNLFNRYRITKQITSDLSCVRIEPFRDYIELLRLLKLCMDYFSEHGHYFSAHGHYFSVHWHYFSVHGENSYLEKTIYVWIKCLESVFYKEFCHLKYFLQKLHDFKVHYRVLSNNFFSFAFR